MLNVRIFNNLENVKFHKRFKNFIEWMILTPESDCFHFCFAWQKKNVKQEDSAQARRY